MKVKYNKGADVLIIRFSGRKVAESDEPAPGVIVDYDKDGNIVGIEVLDASRRVEAPLKIEYEVILGPMV